MLNKVFLQIANRWLLQDKFPILAIGVVGAKAYWY